MTSICCKISNSLSRGGTWLTYTCCISITTTAVLGSLAIAGNGREIKRSTIPIFLERGLYPVLFFERTAKKKSESKELTRPVNKFFSLTPIFFIYHREHENALISRRACNTSL